MNETYVVIRTDTFITEVTEAYDWLLDSNFEIEQNFELAQMRADAFLHEIESLILKISKMPSLGTVNPDSGVRQHPIHGGRYSLRWFVNTTSQNVIVIALADNERPKELRYKFDVDSED